MPAKHLLDAAILVDVKAHIRMVVAREELAQAQRVRRVARADQRHLALCGVDQPHAPQDEGAHDDLGQLGIGLHQRAQLGLADRQHLPRLNHADAREAGQAAQGGELAGEIARKELGQRLLASRAGNENLELARQHHQHLAVALAGLHQRLAGARLQALAARLEARDLARVEPREHLLAALLVDLVRHQGSRKCRFSLALA